MDTQNPRTGQGAGALIVHCGGHVGATRNRPKLQANAAMRRRLSALLWCFPWTLKPQRRAA